MTTLGKGWPALAALVVAVAVGSAIAHLCTSAMPFLVGALINGYGLSATGAGLVGFFQVGALAVSMILIAPIAHRFKPLRVCALGASLAASCNVLIYLAPAQLALICLLATVVGVGYGLILTAAVAAAAGSSRPDLTYAAGNSGALIIVVPMISALPLATLQFGSRGTFLAIPALIVVCAPLLFGLRRTRGVVVGVQVTGTTFVKGVPILAIWSLFSFGTGAMWAFTERIGVALALPGPAIGLVLSTSAFTGLIGTSLAAVCSTRVSRVAALAVGVVGGGASCLMFALATNLWMFATAAVLYWIFTMFVYILLLGTAALLDPTGRLGTFGTGCERLAFAIGAPLGGLMVDYGSYVWVGVAAAIACSVIAPAFLPGLARALAARIASSDATQAAGMRIEPAPKL